MLIKESNNSSIYDDLSYILSDEFMDDMDIISQTNERFDDDDNQPTNKFWTFYGICKTSNNTKISSVSSEFKKISFLVIFNIGELELEEINKILNDDFINYISNVLGYKLSTHINEDYNEEYECYLYDIEFKLNEI